MSLQIESTQFYKAVFHQIKLVESIHRTYETDLQTTRFCSLNIFSFAAFWPIPTGKFTVVCYNDISKLPYKMQK